MPDCMAWRGVGGWSGKEWVGRAAGGSGCTTRNPAAKSCSVSGRLAVIVQSGSSTTWTALGGGPGREMGSLSSAAYGRDQSGLRGTAETPRVSAGDGGQEVTAGPLRGALVGEEVITSVCVCVVYHTHRHANTTLHVCRSYPLNFNQRDARPP